MIAFIQAQPAIVDRLLRHIEVSPFVDLLVRIIQLDEHPAGSGVLEVRHLASITHHPRTNCHVSALRTVFATRVLVALVSKLYRAPH